MRNVIFTVVAKNYFASAITLGKSVNKYVPNSDFIIVLADELDGQINPQDFDFKIIEADKLNIPDFDKLSFLYDVVELSTAIKPYVMLYLMEELEYCKVVYLDPDIWVMNSLDNIFNLLDNRDFVLTPHIVDLDIVSGSSKEEHILNRGVFNLGFIGSRKSETAYSFLNWWKDRLSTSCYRDATLFVDQKWVDFLPVFCTNYEVLSSKSYNIADWNYQERELKYKDKNYYVLEKSGKWERIKFFHFSGIKSEEPDVILDKFNVEDKKEREVLKALINEYQEELLLSGYNKFSVMKYKYNFFNNGEKIELLHRRIYRSILESGEDMEHPFNTDNSGKIYWLIKGKGQLQISNSSISFKERMVRLMLKMVRKIAGDKQYQVYLKALKIYSDINNQIFLLQ